MRAPLRRSFHRVAEVDIENLLTMVIENADRPRPDVLRDLDSGDQGLRVQLPIDANLCVFVVSGAILATHVYVF